MNLDRRSFLALSGGATLFGLRAFADPAAPASAPASGAVSDILRAGIAEKMIHGCVCCCGDGSGLTFDGLMRFSPERRPKWKRGEKFLYACSNFIYLGLIIEKVSGLPLDVAVRQAVLEPLGMTKTSWGPIGGDPMAVQMEMSDHRMVPGVICDPTARGVPFPIGNAGLFSTATDLAKFASALATGKVFSQKALVAVRRLESSEEVHEGVGGGIAAEVGDGRAVARRVGEQLLRLGAANLVNRLQH